MFLSSFSMDVKYSLEISKKLVSKCVCIFNLLNDLILNYNTDTILLSSLYRLIFGVQVNTGFANKLAERYISGNGDTSAILYYCNLQTLGLSEKCQ